MVTVSLTQEEKKKSKLSYFKWRESLVFCEAGEIEIGGIYMKKRLFYVAILCLILTGCGANYTDGTYEAKSSLYEGDSSQGIPGGDYGIVRIRIENGKFIQSHSIYFLSIYRYFLSCVSSKRQIYATVQSYSVYLIKRNLNLTA